MSIAERVLLAGLGAGLLGTCAGWLLSGVVFHAFQARTPQTWRPAEGAAHYAAASGLTLLAAILISTLVALTGGAHVARGAATDGAALGALCWAALAAPVLVSVSVFVNVHRGVIVGLLTEWLVTSVLAGAAAGWLLAR